MKTAMQNLIEQLKIESSNIDENDDREQLFYQQGIQNCVIAGLSFAETEKQQIIKAYDDAFQYVVGGGFVSKTGEQYFEEIYNDKK